MPVSDPTTDKTDKYFYLGSGQNIDIRANNNITRYDYDTMPWPSDRVIYVTKMLAVIFFCERCQACAKPIVFKEDSNIESM